MDEKLNQLRNLLIQEAERRAGKFLIGPTNRPNASALADAINPDEPTPNKTTIQRILLLERNIKTAEARTRPPKKYRPEQELVDGLIDWLGLSDEAELWRVAAAAPQAPLPEKGEKAPRKTARRALLLPFRRRRS